MKKLHFLLACAATTASLTASAESKPQQTSTRIRVIAADDLFAKDVVSSDGKDVGNIEHVVIRTDDGKVDRVVIETEEKGELITIPFEAIQGNISGGRIQLRTSIDKINRAPRLTDVSTLSQPTVIQEVDRYWIPLDTTKKNVPRTTIEKGLETEAIDETADSASKDPARATGQPKAHEHKAPGEVGSPGEQPKGGELGTQTAETETEAGGDFMLLSRYSYRILSPSVATADAIEGMDVYSSDGQQIGEVKEVVIDLDHGYVAYTLVSRGGFLGLGMNYVAAPLQAMHYTDANRLELRVPARTVKNMRGYIDDDVPRSVLLTDLERAYKEFKVTPYWKQEGVATR